MKTMKLNLAGLLVLLVLFTINSCTKEEFINEPMNPIEELNAVMDDPERIDIPAPVGDNSFTNEELKQIDAKRILDEQDIRTAKSLSALSDGYYAFDKGINVSKSFSGLTVFDNSYANVQIVSGGITFNPAFHFDATISGGAAQSAQAYISNTCTGNAAYKVTLKSSYNTSITKNLASWSQTAFTLVGGVVPFWITFKAQIDANVTMNSSASCWVQQGVTVSSNVKVGAKWTRTAGWTNVSNAPNPTFSATTPTFNSNVNLTVVPGLKVYVSANLYSVLGPQLCVNPYFRFYLNAGYGGYYYDRSVNLRGNVYFSLSGLGYTSSLFNRDVFNVSKTFPRYYYR
jgi:hypothetical protein